MKNVLKKNGRNTVVKNGKYYRIKKKDSIYYVRWIDDVPILTDIKDEALQFNKKQAKNVLKLLCGIFILERVK